MTIVRTHEIVHGVDLAPPFDENQLSTAILSDPSVHWIRTHGPHAVPVDPAVYSASRIDMNADRLFVSCFAGLYF